VISRNEIQHPRNYSLKVGLQTDNFIATETEPAG